MLNLKAIAIAAALLCGGASHAGYALVSPPPFYTTVAQSVGGTAGQFGIRVAANDAVAGGVVRAAEGVAVNVGGRAITMPVAYRVAANAATVAARASFGNPAIFAGALAGAAILGYLALDGVQLGPGGWTKFNKSLECANNSCPVYGPLPGFSTPDEYQASIVQVLQTQIPNASFRAGSVDLAHGQMQIIRNGWESLWYSIDISYLPETVTAQEQPAFEADLTQALNKAFADTPSLDEAIKHWPQQFPPIPVELPILNPTPDAKPTPQPLRVPQGEPQPVPYSVPQQWKSPVIDIVPSPTLQEPWRVDMQPKDIIKEDATPPAQPVPVPKPVADPNAPPSAETPVDKTPGLCELYPDILACAKPVFDTPDAGQIERKDKNVSITPDGGWGGGGSCPADRHFKAGGAVFSFKTYCDFMTGIRPVVLAVAWLSAAFILLGLRKSGD